MSTPDHSAAANAALVIDGIRLRRGQQMVFDGLSLHLSQPRIGLIGDNGAGKSSLFRLICGLDAPQTGRVLLHGNDMLLPQTQRQRLVGMLFQNPDDQIIFPTVEEELALGLRSNGLTRQQAQAQARDFLAQRGLAAWAARTVASLSQGQRQYVCWLALLVAAPPLLLLDEPFASLDLPGQALLAQDMAAAQQQIIVSTHHLEHVQQFARVIWLDAGGVRADGSGQAVCEAYRADVAQRSAARALAMLPSNTPPSYAHR